MNDKHDAWQGFWRLVVVTRSIVEFFGGLLSDAASEACT
jgi:hypothetical protein